MTARDELVFRLDTLSPSAHLLSLGMPPGRRELRPVSSLLVSIRDWMAAVVPSTLSLVFGQVVLGDSCRFLSPSPEPKAGALCGPPPATSPLLPLQVWRWFSVLPEETGFTG